MTSTAIKADPAAAIYACSRCEKPAVQLVPERPGSAVYKPLCRQHYLATIRHEAAA